MIHIVFEVVVSTIRQEKEIEGVKIQKEKLKLPIFLEELCIYKIQKKLQVISFFNAENLA